MADLVAFLRARLDEDQRIAEEATPGPWEAREEPNSRHSNLYGEADVFGPGPYDNVATDRDGGCASMDDATHIARHDPVRVLAEVAAKRELIREIQYFEDRIDGEWGVGTGTKDVDSALRYLAVPYADHPDFDPKWGSQ